jgi:cytidylate kinase
VFTACRCCLHESAGDALTAGCFLHPQICRIEKHLKIRLVLDGRDAGAMQLQGAPAKITAGAQARLSRWKYVNVATDASAAGFNRFLLDLLKQ